MLSRNLFEQKVVEYATKWVSQYIKLSFSGYSQEIQEEMSQEALCSVANKLPKIEEKEGWMSFVQQKCAGAVKDYLKAGGAFEEEKKSIKEAAARSDGRYIFSRMNNQKSIQKGHSREMVEVGIDDFLSQADTMQKLSINVDDSPIRWDLVARMARVDRGLNYFARWLRGWSFEEIGEHVGHCKSTVGVHIESFIDRFDDNSWAKDPWMKQTLYAFNICDQANVKDIDYSRIYGYQIGWNETPVDLDGPQVGDPKDLNPEAINYV